VKPRYRCPVCRRFVTVRKDGTLARHIDYSGSTCAGVGQPPSEPLLNE